MAAKASESQPENSDGRHSQTLTLRSDGTPIVITTPMGMIKIHRLQGEGRKVIMDLPAGLMGFVSEERALDRSAFLARDEEGRIVPKFKLLAPLTGPHGELVGVCEPSRFRLELRHELSDSQAMANVAGGNSRQ